MSLLINKYAALQTVSVLIHTFILCLGFATIIFWGRFGVPVPYRIPIVGAMAKPFPVPLKENPTPEEIDAVHEELMQAMVKLFDTHKEAYGWGDKKLIIE